MFFLKVCFYLTSNISYIYYIFKNRRALYTCKSTLVRAFLQPNKLTENTDLLTIDSAPVTVNYAITQRVVTPLPLLLIYLVYNQSVLCLKGFIFTNRHGLRNLLRSKKPESKQMHRFNCSMLYDFEAHIPYISKIWSYLILSVDW